MKAKTSHLTSREKVKNAVGVMRLFVGFLNSEIKSNHY